MKNQGEKTCPLCAEEMDLTDQQLKPCKCGYEICVWCWHQILDMAEKDDAGGRCPACRIPYDKEKIVGMSANCKNPVGDPSMEKKKSCKAKTRTAEVRKQLISVRVVQRHLVYIVGLPINLAKENLLLCKDYFGQYGKVLNLSMSRTSAGTVQQFPNNTCSVYIKYSNEEEAVRCIKSVHGFTLDGSPLRACFGTTKYCHAWLRNAPCTNPECLYLHEIGPQEDSFEKDDSVSAHARVQQITGVTIDMQWRSGNVLPRPVDEYCNKNSASGKSDAKGTPTIIASSARVSTPSRSVERTCALPATASWGTRESNCQSSSGSSVCSNEPSSAPKTFSAAVGGMMKSSVQTTDLARKIILNDNGHHPEALKNKPKLMEEKKQHPTNIQIHFSENFHAPVVDSAAPVATRHSIEELYKMKGTEDRLFASDEENHKVCSDIPPMNIDEQRAKKNSEVARPNGFSLDCFLVRGGSECNDAKLQTHLVSRGGKTAMFVDGGASASRIDMQSSASLNLQSGKEEVFDIQRLPDPIATSQTSLFSSSQSFDVLDSARSPSHHDSDAAGAVNHTVNGVNNQIEEYFAAVTSNTSVASNDLVDTDILCNSCIAYPCVLSDGLHGIQVGTSDNQAVNVNYHGMDLMESSIIANILSLDIDAWDGTLTSQDLVKLLGENEKQQSTFSLLNSQKDQDSNESRFSFARQDESHSHFLDGNPSFISEESLHSSNPALVATREPYSNRLGNNCRFFQHNEEQYNCVGSSQSIFSTNKLPASRAQISAPPGFSVHNRIPPPGFSPHETRDQTSKVQSGNHFLEVTSSLRNPYEPSPFVNNSKGVSDAGFIDTAILAVGKGRHHSSLSNSAVGIRPTFLSQTSAFENDSRLQLLMQQSLQPHLNHRYNDVGDSYSYSAAYISSSSLMEPLQNGNLSSLSHIACQPMSGIPNDQLGTWPKGMAGNSMGMPELLQSNQPGLYNGYEDSKFQISGSGAVFNRTTFGF